MDVRPIRTEADYDWALAEIEPYFDNNVELTPERADRFEVLAALIGAYEAEHWPIEPADPVEIIEFMMEQNGRTQADLGRLLGSRPRASEILSRKRPLTMEMIRKLQEQWNIPAELLIRPYTLAEVKTNPRSPPIKAKQKRVKGQTKDGAKAALRA